jgi:HSP20 family molecular chaperone IbpA
LEIKLPGVTEKDLEVNFESGNLTIQSTLYEARLDAEKKEAANAGGSVSYSTGNEKNPAPKKPRIRPFRKIYRLPKDADPHGISALLCNGVLSLEISKKAIV